jgi:hypothetical protein
MAILGVLMTVIGDRPSGREAGPREGAAWKWRTTNQRGRFANRIKGQIVEKGPKEEPQRSLDHEREVGMTRTNVMASSRPQTAGTSMTRSGSSRARRRLMILPVVLALAVAPAAPAFAVEPNYGNSQANKPSPEKPGSGTSPSKSTKTPTSTTPAKTVEPATTSSAPTTATHPAKASTLPFTGLDLRWTVGVGLLLVCAGGSIMVMQRRQRRDTGL